MTWPVDDSGGIMHQRPGITDYGHGVSSIYDVPMKAVCLVETGAPLAATDLGLPGLGQEDVLVRVVAAGICHSDAHYRAGASPVAVTPMALGHEVAGVIEAVGALVDCDRVGERVGLHYLVGCGACVSCRAGRDAFCPRAQMLGKDRHGGYAEYVVVPSVNAITIPDEVDDDVAAVMMCSTVTALHALRRAQFRPEESVAVFGCGGLGMSAIRLAVTLGAGPVFAVDVSSAKLVAAAAAGAHPINARELDPANTIRAATQRRGVDVSLEFVGTPQTVDACIRATGVQGRAAMVAIMDVPAPIYTYRDLIAREISVLGVSDHLRQDVEDALGLAARGALQLSSVVSRRVALDAVAINAALDALEAGTSDVRVVIRPDVSAR